MNVKYCFLVFRWDNASKDFSDTEFPDQSVSEAANYCRNPNNTRDGGPWCYTERSDVNSGYCDIPYCSQ